MSKYIELVEFKRDENLDLKNIVINSKDELSTIIEEVRRGRPT